MSGNPTNEPSTVLPTRFGRYRIASKIAAGGMATVYLARSGHGSGFEKLVALKAIHGHLADQGAFVDMFLDECRIASSIDHPNVCTVFDFGQEQGIYYLAMEFLLGEPLSRIARTVARRKQREELVSLPWYIARIIADACEGLHAAHELTDTKGEHLGVVHRDVSPENIVVTYDGAVKLVDFGVAKAAQRIHETQVAKIKGKFAYVSPEQVRNEDLDRRTDIWGLGVCLWESLTLKRLFRRDTDAATLSAVLFDEVPAPSTVRKWVPPSLDAIVLRALSRDPNDRYPDARALGLDLRRFLTESGATIGLAESGEWMQRLFADERKRRIEMVQRAKQGLVTGAFALEKNEGSTSEGTMPSVSVQMSKQDIEDIEERAGQAPTIAPPARGRRARHDDATEKMPRPSEDLPGDDELMRGIRGRGSKIALGLLVLVALAAGVFALRPDLRERAMIATGLADQPPPPPPPEPPPPPSRGDVTFEVSPEEAHVLLFVGRAPVTLDAPNGTELYAVADDGAAGHAVLAGEGPGEMTILLNEEPAALGPFSRPSGASRAMTVTTSIPRAKVYRRVGTGARVVLGDVDVDEALELLVLAEGHTQARVLVSPDEWHRDSEEIPSATTRVTLQPLAE